MLTQSDRQPIIIAVAGGKGGVGKTVFSAAAAAALAGRGMRCVVLDLDLGAANLHTYLGLLTPSCSLADFMQKKTNRLSELLIPTTVENLHVISSARHIDGLANPPHWLKMKLIRHIRQLPCQVVVLDLGAGVNYNVLDFFSCAHAGIVISMPEPGAIMNAYGFIKSFFYRKVQRVFSRHPEIGPVIKSKLNDENNGSSFSLSDLRDLIAEKDLSLPPVLAELQHELKPMLVMNRITETTSGLLANNLVNLCRKELALQVRMLGNLPELSDISRYLVNLPDFFTMHAGRRFLDAVLGMLLPLVTEGNVAENNQNIDEFDFNDDELHAMMSFIDMLDENYFSGTNKSIWKYRLYYKPSLVLQFLADRGVPSETFFKYRQEHH